VNTEKVENLLMGCAAILAGLSMGLFVYTLAKPIIHPALILVGVPAAAWLVELAKEKQT
jgi:CHASE2 domain-containing sensor protein